jgi:hypothetical protein
VFEIAGDLGWIHDGGDDFQITTAAGAARNFDRKNTL